MRFFEKGATINSELQHLLCFVPISSMACGLMIQTRGKKQTKGDVTEIAQKATLSRNKEKALEIILR